MKRTLIVCAWLVALWVPPASAQVAALQSDRLAWDQQAASLADANGFKYQAYLDGAPAGVTLVVDCQGAASPYTCTARLPPLTPGQHTVQLTAAMVLPDSRIAESEKSPVFSFRVFVGPMPPAQIRLVP